MITLGINGAYHEAAACLVADGRVVAAAEEERFTRRKQAQEATPDRGADLPLAAIDYCTAAAGVAIDDVDEIGFSLAPKLRLRNRDLHDHVVEGGWGSAAGEQRFYDALTRVPARLRELGFRGAFRWVEQHRCHTAAAFFPSPFERAAVLCVDAVGELASTTLAVGQGTALEPLSSVDYPASLGCLWERFCTFLGFGEHEAGKVMGLGAYGDASRFRRALHELVVLLPDGAFAMRNEVLRFRAPDDDLLGAVLGTRRRRKGSPIRTEDMDLAASLQEVTTEVVLHLARDLHRRAGVPRLCLSGTVALNCVTNARLAADGPFRDLYIPVAPHNAGTALGAALHLSLRSGGRRSELRDPYLGSELDERHAMAELVRRGLPFQRVTDIVGEVARRLAAGQVVAWFQGRMELGPQALGNRSLLADPRQPEMRGVLDYKVKHRDLYRPYGPSVLSEHAADWFVLPRASRPAELMLLAVPARTATLTRVPTVVHVDGSSRVHLVRREVNPRYHALISAFYALTGVPMLLNTSLHDDEPLGCTPREVLDAFHKSRVDCVALGDLLIERPPGS